MPFADDTSMIACLLQHFCDRGLASVEAIKNRHAVEMAVLAGQDGGAARRANRIDGETIQQAHAFVGDAVEVGCLIDFAAIFRNYIVKFLRDF